MNLALSASLWIVSASLVCAQTLPPLPSLPLPNPGFEDGDIVPDGWTVWSSGPDEDNQKDLRRPTEADFIWDCAVARTGRRCLYIWNDGPRWASWRSSSPVAVRPDTSYRLGIWIRKAGGASSTYVRVRGSGWTTYGIFDPGREWSLYSFKFKTPSHVETLTIELSDLGGNGSETWFDDLELVELPPQGRQ